MTMQKMNVTMKTARILGPLVVTVAVLAGCGTSTGEVSTTAEGRDDGTALLTITATDDYGGPGGPPPWDQFAVELAPVTWVEQTTAVGEGVANGATPLGASCDQLLADFPDLTGCQEYVDRYPQTGTFVDVGQLDPDGTMTIPLTTAPGDLRIHVVDPNDSYCDWYGSEKVEPNQTEVVIGVGLGCS